eukprot:TRINITY_DN375_c4_g1_i1.p1 TRINITY_DN375_c4_g1~~TRINITY_DN375_c4_g1_i1.p1  ORF type:complete len:286 (-),score=33.28 TRINITY_DN375_c4_g1_i1:90-947(-)
MSSPSLPSSVAVEDARVARRRKVKMEISRYFSGLAGGVLSAATGYPLDAARVRFLFGSKMHNLANGFAFSFVYSILKSGLVWPVQRQVKGMVDQLNLSEWSSLVASGAIGNVLPGIMMNPFNVMKVRLMESHTKYTVRETFHNIRHGEGVHVFARGLSATIIRDFLWGMVYFPLFSAIRKQLKSEDELSTPSSRFWTATTAAAGAAATATSLTSFLDSIRLFQMKSVGSSGTYHSFLDGLRLAIFPSRRNFLATATGVARVTVSTVVGHVTFLYVSKYLSGDDEL